MTELTQEIVRELLDYDPVSGILTWKRRKPSAFAYLGHKAATYAHTFNVRFEGKEAFTSSHDFGYKQGSIFSLPYKAHRVIWLWMTGEWPEVIDHINGDPSDNRWENLRNVDPEGNCKNSRKPITNTSGYANIRSRKGRKTFTVQIRVEGKNKHIGTFSDLDEAIDARNMAWEQAGYHKNHCL